MMVINFCSGLNCSLAVVPCGLQVTWLVCWQAGWLVDRLNALGSRRTASREGFLRVRGRGSSCRRTLSFYRVVGLLWCFVLVLTSCCSAVSLPPTSSPRPGPCGSRVWGSESCGCSGSRPPWSGPSPDPPACSGNWNHPVQGSV